MKRRITIAISFLVTLWFFDNAVRRWDDRLAVYDMDRIGRKLALLESLEEPPEVLILGSSRTAYAMVPEEFERVTGMKSFNFGIPASKVVEWRLIAREALNRVRPRVILLGVNASAIRADYRPIYAAQSLFEPSDFVEYTLANGWSSDVAAGFFERELMLTWPTARRNHEIRYWIQERLVAAFPKHAQLARERREMVAEPGERDGFDHPWLFHKRMKNLQQQIDERGDRFVQKGSVPTFDLAASSMAELDRLLFELKSTRIPIIVCYLPNSPRTERRWRDVEPRMKMEIESVCRRRGVAFIDASPTDIVRSNGDYLDESHAGLSLARALSEHAARRIVTLGVLDSDGPVYASSRDEGQLGP